MLKKLRLMLLISSLVAVIGLTQNQASALTATTVGQDCDSNAVIYCGAHHSKTVIAAYMDPNGASTRAIYNYFGIQNSDITEFESKAVLGQVTKSGEVKVNGEVIANNAVTAGRSNMPGSTKVSVPYATFYKRPPSVSFRSDSLEAFVVKDGAGKFKYAIIITCGNPVMATPVTPPPAPTPPPTVIKRIEQPVKIVKVKKVVVKKVVRKVKKVEALPDTGGSGLSMMAPAFTLTSLLGAAGHYGFKRRFQIMSKIISSL